VVGPELRLQTDVPYADGLAELLLGGVGLRRQRRQPEQLVELVRAEADAQPVGVARRGAQLEREPLGRSAAGRLRRIGRRLSGGELGSSSARRL